MTNRLAISTAFTLAALLATGCATQSTEATSPADATTNDAATPPPNIQAWMDRLTVDHTYNPETGFIVAEEVITLPAPLDSAPPLDEAIALAASDGRTVIAFATADRCAPCQQYKKDALNDARVAQRLSDGELLATHVEVDQRPELADAYLGGRGIPMTYALRDGKVIDQLRGQRSAEELLEWLGRHTAQ